MTSLIILIISPCYPVRLGTTTGTRKNQDFAECPLFFAREFLLGIGILLGIKLSIGILLGNSAFYSA